MNRNHIAVSSMGGAKSAALLQMIKVIACNVRKHLPFAARPQYLYFVGVLIRSQPEVQAQVALR
jgi:hypothetical protein